jgi:hypothetical protein
MSDAIMQQVLEGARLLFQPGDVVEVRVPRARNEGVISGYFDDFEAMAQAVRALEPRRFPGIYWTINPVLPSLLARCKNRLQARAKVTAEDKHVVVRRRLLIDLDPVRPAEISSTAAEKEAAERRMEQVVEYLSAAGWPEPIKSDSGNGWHLLYAVELPNDDASKWLVESCLKALAARFDDSIVEVDKTVFNASRICKIYGTTARKGDDVDDRPHRTSKLVYVPALLTPVPVELLRALADQAPGRARQQPVPIRPRSEPRQRGEFDLREFLDRYGVRYRDPVPCKGGYKFTLEACPFDPSHQNKDAAVFDRSDGYGFKCFHNSCSGRDWREFRELFEPDAYRGGSAGGQYSKRNPANPQINDAPVTDRVSEADLPPPRPDGADEEDEYGLTLADIQAGVDDAIARDDLDAALLLIPEIARLPALAVLRIKTSLTTKFKRKFSLKGFEAAIRDERRRAMAGLPPEASSLPLVIVNNRPMRDVVAESLAALRASNDPPMLYVRSGDMVFVEMDERQRPSIENVSKAHLRGRLDRAANYVKRGSESDISVPPPLEVVEDILALPSAQWGVPPLEFVVEVPTLRPDGTVLSSPGYDPISRMLYAPAPGFAMDPIPDYVDAEQLAKAIALIDEAIGDFPYADREPGSEVVYAERQNPNRANLFGLLLTPIVRPAISGVVPLALIDAPQAGTGKSLLVDLFSIMTTGRAAAMMPFPRNEEEMQKSIGATLLAGGALVCFDNVEGILSSPTLALVLTARDYQTRILGLSENMIAPNRATWLATGNNIRPSGDMPRRCFHIRLDAKKSRPYQGREFKHANLLEWATEVRPLLLRSLLIIARAWYQLKVKPPIASAWGSFEAWHRTVGGILRSAGIEGFLANLQQFLEEADDNALQWEAFLSDIATFTNGAWFKTALIVQDVRSGTPVAPSRLTLPDSLGDVDRRKEGSLERALGKSFAKRLGTRFGDDEVHLERKVDKHTKQSDWRVLSRESGPAGSPADLGAVTF